MDKRASSVANYAEIITIELILVTSDKKVTIIMVDIEM